MIKLDYTDRYYVDRILHQQQVDYLQRLREKGVQEGLLRQENFFGLVNRFYFTDKANLKFIYEVLLERAIEVNELLGRETNIKLKTAYFQEYLVNSHLPEHRDILGKNGVTLVTLVDRSDDLIGGDLLVIDKMSKFKEEHGLDHIQDDPYTRVKDFEDVNVYTLLPQEVGETAMYITGTVHSITKVLKGQRLVLVTWFDT